MLGKIVYKSHYGPSARRIAAKRASLNRNLQNKKN